MRVFRGFGRLPAASHGVVAAIGNFDGLHLGHQAVLDATKALAAEKMAPWGLVTFEPHPKDVLAKGHRIERLTPFRRKVEILREIGCAQLMVLPFTKTLIGLSAEAFVRSILHDQLGLAGAVTGADFRFGNRRAGDVTLLAEMLQELAIASRTVSLQSNGGEICSSTSIRQHLAAGRMADANRLLGRPHQIIGVVRPGDQRGRGLGFPTANTYPANPQTAMPGSGIYVVTARLLDRPDEPWMNAVASLGKNPTFDGDEVRLEVHILDRLFDDLYGRRLRVRFHERLRGEIAYTTVDALVAQIAKDCDQARQHLALLNNAGLTT